MFRLDLIILDLIDRVPEELWMEVRDIAQEAEIETIPKKKKCKKAKWLSWKALQIAGRPGRRGGRGAPAGADWGLRDPPGAPWPPSRGGLYRARSVLACFHGNFGATGWAAGGAGTPRPPDGGRPGQRGLGPVGTSEAAPSGQRWRHSQQWWLTRSAFRKIRKKRKTGGR